MLLRLRIAILANILLLSILFCGFCKCIVSTEQLDFKNSTSKQAPGKLVNFRFNLMLAAVALRYTSPMIPQLSATKSPRTVAINSKLFQSVLQPCRPALQGLWVRGYEPERLTAAVGQQNAQTLAVVGSRKASPYGIMTTKRLVTAAVKAGFTIVSGLAYGIDAAAHQATIAAQGRGIAVLPTDVDHVYPAQHHQLAAQLLEGNGWLVSEFQHNPRPQRYHFVARNRIIAALAGAVLIVEAGPNSGALHTAQFALDYGKDVLVVPGPISSNSSAGCHRLIQEGAQLVASSQDLLQYLGVNPQINLKSLSEPQNSGEGDIFAIERALASGPQTAAQLAAVCQIDAARMGNLLMDMELRSTIRRQGLDLWELG